MRTVDAYKDVRAGRQTVERKGGRSLVNAVLSCATMGVMESSYEFLMREVLGDPLVNRELWEIVTSVSEGDEAAYADALLAIARSYDWSMVGDSFMDDCTPGVALDGLLNMYPYVDGFCYRSIAAHPNVTSNGECRLLQAMSREVSERLAGNSGVSGETVEELMRSQSHWVIGALLGNDALSEDALRRAERRAREIDMSTLEIVNAGCGNASMPVDIVVSWLTCSGDQARIIALSSPVAPRDILWECLMQEVSFNTESPEGMSIFADGSNAGGDMIDWFLSRWEKHAGKWLRNGTIPACEIAAENALTHPRTRPGMLERLYARYGGESEWLRGVVADAVSCPDWVRRDKSVVGNVKHVVSAATSKGAPPEIVRDLYLYDMGASVPISCCSNVPSGLMVKDLEKELRAKTTGQWSWAGIHKVRVSGLLLHQSMPPDVRRECARWFPEALWLVARDGFMGRASK